MIGAAAAGLAFAADQISKYWLIQVYDVGARQPIRLAPFLDVVLAWNRGVSYSLLSANGPLGRFGLLALAAAAMLALALWLWRTTDRLTAFALGLVMGGALGNALDRFNFGAVADFFYLHTTLPVGPLANYVFNVADCAIVAGVALLLYESLRPRPTAPAALETAATKSPRTSRTS
ncbi:MAG: signal peptidase II [Hyphomicrobiales bacterium]|nr:signal peptidase II [Hyphomicrobiales bacterium]